MIRTNCLAITLVFGAPAGLLAASPDCSTLGPGSPLRCLYAPAPDFTTILSGDFSTGIALADLNRDGYPDLVVANGYDAAPQMLKVYHHRGAGSDKPFGHFPDWVSEESGHLMDLAVGDVDGDGWLDVAVAMAFGTSHDLSTGGVAVYRNRQGRLEPRPSYRTAGGYMATGCALADLDADGDLDLAVAVLVEGSGNFTEDLSRAGYGRARVYPNGDGALSPFPAWISAEPLGAAQVVAADLDQDGWMDLAFAAQRTSVFRGRLPTAGGGFPLPPAPDWTSAERSASSAGIDAAPPETGGADRSVVPRGEAGLRLAVSVGCVDLDNLLAGQKVQATPGCTSRLLIHRIAAGREPVWSSGPLDNASRVRWADLNADGFSDLVADQWGAAHLATPTEMGGPLLLFQGSARGLAEQPAFQSSQQRIGFGLALADVQRRGLAEKRHTFEARGAAAVVTLPGPAASVAAVERRKEGESRRLSSREYATVPGAGWISLSHPLAPGETLTVTYQTSPVVDIAVAVGNPQHGSDLYSSRLAVDAVKHSM